METFHHLLGIKNDSIAQYIDQFARHIHVLAIIRNVCKWKIANQFLLSPLDSFISTVC